MPGRGVGSLSHLYWITTAPHFSVTSHVGFIRLLLLLLIQIPYAHAHEVPDLLPRPGCSGGSCYPPTGNLVVGRSQSLHASSTCGLRGPEPYCIVSHLQDSEKCFFCDSRGQGGHRIKNVISLSGPDGQRTWWQAESGVENVSIQLDLEGEFYFTHLIMTFKTFRPAGLLIERSADGGRSWRVYRYFAHNCSGLFPGIPLTPGRKVSDLVCDQRYSNIEPSSQGEVIFKVLDPAIPVEDPYSPEIQELLRVTNLRVNFSKLHTLGDGPLGGWGHHRGPHYYYALYELVVRGSCLCHGHASECAPAPGAPPSVDGMVHGLCVCQHWTAGPHCERCQDLHHDQPWRPAEPGNPHACQECECHHHARSCHFDVAVFVASGNVSGGVCDACQHHTAGRHCEICRPFYHRDPREDPRSPYTCKPCDCDPSGTLDGGLCDTHTDEVRGLLSGQCRCKAHVWGPRCDTCRPGYYGLSPALPEGCLSCRCDPRGTVPGDTPCDSNSGDCYCKRFVTGQNCDQCLPEFWGLSSDFTGCRPCDCDFGGAYSNRCSSGEGLCPCRPHLQGRDCLELQSGYFCAALDQAIAEAELGQRLKPSDPRLPGTPLPGAPRNCLPTTRPMLKRLRPRLRRQRSTPCPPYITRRGHHSHQPSKVKSRWESPGDERRLSRAAVGPRPWGRGPHASSWTGPGFARVEDRAGLMFQAPPVPRAMEYDIVLRYEAQAPEDWEALVSVRAYSLPSSTRCANVLPSEQLYHVALPSRHRAVVLSRPFCFEPGTRYTVTLRLQRGASARNLPMGTILLDSLVLLPRVEELPGLRRGDPGASGRWREFSHAQCLEAARTPLLGPPSESCARLVCSISALLYGGGLACECDPQGSLSSECARVGGQCPCRPYVIGQRCDRCEPQTYGFGPAGCSECRCSPEGSTSLACDPSSGQCPCQPGITGQRCDQCLPGQWGFPQCQPCECNGHAEQCHPHTGVCQACRDATTGRHCERCQDGYYGDPVLGSGQQCRPCPCPGFPGSGSYHGTSCQADGGSERILCLCAPGYAGPRCDRCSAGYFGRPWPEGVVGGAPCRPCQCNNNIDPSDPMACDPLSGHCQRCLHHTHGPHCSHCQPGYYGNALRPRGCRRCSCDLQGTVPAQCLPESGICFCDRLSGHCPCRLHVLGRLCDRCAPQFWNLGGLRGCEPCACHIQHSLQLTCHPVTGQCSCREGFGGRTCSQCQEGYWGDPEKECRACACDPQGSVSLRCHPRTGACSCLDGISGPQCKACARGSQGSFPHCRPCPTCFFQWDGQLDTLQQQLATLAQGRDALSEAATDQGRGGQLLALEAALGQVQGVLVSTQSLMGPLQQLMKQRDGLRREVSVLGRALRAVERNVGVSGPWAGAQHSRLGQLTQEVEHLNHLTTQLKEAPGGAQDAASLVSRAVLISQEAEFGVTTALMDTESALSQSHNVRSRTEGLLQEMKPPFRTVAWGEQLQGLVNASWALSPSLAQLKVCGEPWVAGRACAHFPCGPASCSGALPTSLWALGTAHNTSHALSATGTRLGRLHRRLQRVGTTAGDAHSQAEETLSRAQATWRGAGTGPILATIQRIRAFLTNEGADPESVELVAQRVLKIPLPQGGQRAVEQLLEEIQDALQLPDSMDWALPSAQGLLQQAHWVRKHADRTQDNVAKTQRALAEAQNNVGRAERELRKTKHALRGLEVQTQEMALGLVQATRDLNVGATLDQLLGTADALQAQVSENKLQLREAQGQAEQASDIAANLGKELQTAKLQFSELQSGINGLGNEVNGARDRLQQIQAEAKELLKKANRSWSRLEGLEKRFARNEQALGEKAAELRVLENRALGLLEQLRQEASAHATC
ncbi:laminin subunit beta-2-like isoform X3 [Notamacropus eugenii]|uniref:laminin subunit beta-2-like isoform X3 n=1 Tax=Notamacropus eugenii TaxID=9315 RepID=UPI003B675B92